MTRLSQGGWDIGYRISDTGYLPIHGECNVDMPNVVTFLSLVRAVFLVFFYTIVVSFLIAKEEGKTLYAVSFHHASRYPSRKFPCFLFLTFRFTKVGT